MSDCVFCKLINGSIPTKVFYQDEDIFVFQDIRPKAEVHLLIVPKRHINSMLELTDSDQALVGKMMIMSNKLALEHGLNNGYKMQVNTGINGGQEVYHLHIHVFGNR